MDCPHCNKAIHPSFKTVELGFVGEFEKKRVQWYAKTMSCPSCLKPIVLLEARIHYRNSIGSNEFMAFPRKTIRPQAPPEVPPEIAEDFNEACLVIEDSPKASAALSRRCLQHLLNERNVSQSNNLNKAINDALDTHLPSHIADNLDAIRNIGNFAAHPQKSENTGEILPVEPEEAEWNLDVLEMLFDYYYVQPAKSKTRRDALNAKLAEAGKKPIKGTPEESSTEETT